MDLILITPDVLEPENWINFKIYQDPSITSDITSWKRSLDWYHKLLKDVIKPLVENKPEVRAIFFGIYGPCPYGTDDEEYEKQIPPPSTSVEYTRLRLSVRPEDKKKVKNTFTSAFDSQTATIWDYETMVTYHVRCDLGRRFGSNTDRQTLLFIRYWDSACRYILSILTLPENWASDVDVWGVPHLINNSLGSWLRPENPPVLCPKCQSHMYMATWYVLDRPVTNPISAVPHCLFVCPNCFWSVFKSYSI